MISARPRMRLHEALSTCRLSAECRIPLQLAAPLRLKPPDDGYSCSAVFGRRLLLMGCSLSPYAFAPRTPLRTYRTHQPFHAIPPVHTGKPRGERVLSDWWVADSRHPQGRGPGHRHASMGVQWTGLCRAHPTSRLLCLRTRRRFPSDVETGPRRQPVRASASVARNYLRDAHDLRPICIRSASA